MFLSAPPNMTSGIMILLEEVHNNNELCYSGYLVTGYWIRVSIVVSWGIGDLAYLFVLVGTGINLGFLLRVPIASGFGTYHLVSFGCLLLITENCFVIPESSGI